MSETLIIADVPPRRCRHCQAVCADAAKFCWMCGSPTTSEGASSVVPAKLVEMVDNQRRTDSWALRLAPLLAVPVVAVVVYGLYGVDRTAAWLFGPGLVIGALFAVGHQLLFKAAIRPQGTMQRASVAGSSLLMGLLAGVVTVTVTVVVALALFLLMVASIVIAILEFCGMNAGG